MFFPMCSLGNKWVFRVPESSTGKTGPLSPQGRLTGPAIAPPPP